ncbi:TetR/AcrR family transcriptional regulator [Streptomyces avicenniae]|uniref:TetR/AcrR family transcriptional regulator n=1 Tax=Streptomyces avicenniae TaxID=500153 RepID=UPI00069A82E8|nr:TetR/AcrR family transcriptional regulator [Streptomyces avicenniae]
MTTAARPGGRPRGRPRGFDRGAALARAMEVFWALGYEGATMGELTTAMGINSPSLYAAFGSKEELFREAVALYDATEGTAVTRALSEEPTARAAVATVLRETARACTEPGRPTGCMIVVAALNCSQANSPARDFLSGWRREGDEALTRRLEQGVRDGDVPAGTDTAAASAFLGAVLHGMSIRARDGATRAELERTAETTLTAWDVLYGAERP